MREYRLGNGDCLMSRLHDWRLVPRAASGAVMKQIAAALRGQFGEASAVAVIELGIILCLVLTQNVLLRERG